MNPAEIFDQAMRHYQAGELPRAAALCAQILAADPGDPNPMHCLGVIACRSGRYQESADWIRRAIAIAPDRPEYHSNLAIALTSLGLREQALASLRRAIELQPDSATHHENLGGVLRVMKRWDEAAVEYRRAIELDPANSACLFALATVLQRAGHWEETIVCLRQVAALRPDSAEAQVDLACALYMKDTIDEAVQACRAAIAIDPTFSNAHNNLGNTLRSQGKLDEALAAYEQASALTPDYGGYGSNRLFAIQFHPDFDAPTILREHRLWATRYAQPAKKNNTHENQRSRERRLKIGYVSGDFYDHVVARNILPLFREHDRAGFEIFCYSNVNQSDAMTRELRRHAQVWRNTLTVNDEQMAELIRRDGIDVLVDLSLHMPRNRLTVFARKPSPVQVTFAAYPGGTGVAEIDWRITDPYLDPPQADGHYVERSYRLPHSFWCYDAAAMQQGWTPLAAEHVMERRETTFGCLNHFAKINQGILSLWSRVLQAATGSRLRMLAPVGQGRRWVLESFETFGINPDRVDFVSRMDRAAYMAEFSRIDVCLDTLPYNGHTTSLDAMWMGTPVVTRIGPTVVGRAGWSQLSNLGLTELAGHDDEQFVKIATELAADRLRLAELRRTLPSRMRQSPLTDAGQFARHIEAAYRDMWRQWCQR